MKIRQKRPIKILICLLLVFATLFVFASCKKKAPVKSSGDGAQSSLPSTSNETGTGMIEITSLKLNKGSLSLKVGESETLTYTVTPPGANSPELLWKTDDAQIATVDKGKVTALKEGQTEISLYSADGKFTVVCKVTVIGVDPADVTGVQWKNPLVVLKAGEKVALSAEVSPGIASEKALTYKSSNELVATVSEGGELSAVKEGLITVTVTCGGKSDECTVLVLDKDGKLPAAAKKSVSFKANDTLTFTVDQPLYKKAEGLSYTSSNEAVVSVKDGKLTALKAGTAVVTVKMDGNAVFEYSCTVTGGTSEKVKVTGVKMSKSEIEVEVGKTVQLSAAVLPANATEQTVWWISEDSKVAKVDKDGNVTGLSKGECYVTVCTKDGEYTAICRVYVRESGSDPTLVEVTGIKVKTEKITVKVGETFRLEYTVLPENATNKSVYFVSENKDILSVDKEGNVKALKAGKGVVTVGTSGTDFTALCYVTVEESAPSSSSVAEASSIYALLPSPDNGPVPTLFLRRLNGKASE